MNLPNFIEGRHGRSIVALEFSGAGSAWQHYRIGEHTLQVGYSAEIMDGETRYFPFHAWNGAARTFYHNEPVPGITEGNGFSDPQDAADYVACVYGELTGGNN